MQNKNIILVGITCLVLGSFIGSQFFPKNMEHTMNDGSKMAGSMHHEMSMDTMMQDMKNSLKGKEGDEFDKEFLKQMIVHHEGAVLMAEDVLISSKRPELIKLANDIISAQKKEIDMMKDWQINWFK
jgi:uncharacterized protein (DUF305 family)